MRTGATPIGLCASCRHVRWVRSERGASFALCGRATSDPRFACYPRLPVLVCAGHADAGPPRRVKE